VFIKYEKNTTKQFCVYILDLDYVIRFFIMTFDELKKDNIIDLRFRSIRNTLSDREPRDKLSGPRQEISTAKALHEKKLVRQAF
jgi:hypothetical protein